MERTSSVTVSSTKDHPQRLGKRLLLVFLWVMLPVLLGLSVWQLQRAEQKQQRLDRLAQDVQPLGSSAQRAQRVPFNTQVQGRFMTGRYFLLDNRTRSGRAGYEVIGILKLDSSELLPVNMGWIPAPQRRDQLPQVVVPSERLELSGVLQANRAPLLLGAGEQVSGWPRRIQALDAAELSKMLNQTVAAQTLWVVNSPLTGAQTAWQWVNLPPEKHLGYALQWFLLALVGLFVVVRLQFFTGEPACQSHR